MVPGATSFIWLGDVVDRGETRWPPAPLPPPKRQPDPRWAGSLATDIICKKERKTIMIEF